MEVVMETELGKYNFKDLMSHELVVASYAYNEQEPRFFSKYFNYLDKGVYDVKVGIATGASAAAPTFFDPQEVQNAYGIVEKLVDGAVICNNPAYYAYQIANKIYKKKDIRMVSLGTGESTFKPFDPDHFDRSTLYSSTNEFLMNIEVYTSDFGVKVSINDPKNNYVRSQVVSDLPMD